MLGTYDWFKTELYNQGKFDMRMKLLVLLVPAGAILAGACATSASAETLNTWAMLLVGFLGLGYAARPRRKKSRLEGLTASHVPQA
jgi:hypothetical protein